MRKTQARAAAEDDEFGGLLEQKLEVPGRERVERRHGPRGDGRIGQQHDARFMAYEIDVHVMGAVSGYRIERAARVLV